MKKKYRTEKAARAEANRLLAKVNSMGMLLRASVTERKYRCGKANCKCTRGSLHTDLIATRKIDGRTQTVKIRAGREKEANDWLRNWKKQKQLLEKLTTIEMEILAMPGGENT